MAEWPRVTVYGEFDPGKDSGATSEGPGPWRRFRGYISVSEERALLSEISEDTFGLGL